MELKFSKSENLNTAYIPYFEDETRLQIFFGGSSSGKSKFLAQRCVMDIICGGRNYLVVRKVAGTIRRSVFNEILKVIEEWNLSRFFHVQQQDLIITNKDNGFQILFAGLDDVEKLKSITPAKGVLTDAWIEEATEAERDDLKQLNKRLRGMSRKKKRTILSFNPILKSHWIYQEYFDKKWQEHQKELREDKLSILKTTYKDNRFLSPEDIEDLENEDDFYYYQVYCMGNWGTFGGVIFTKWDEKSENKFGTWRVESFDTSKFDSFLYGQDFGYSKDPAAGNEVSLDKKNRRLYICDELHEFELTNERLAGKLKPFVGKNYVTCDSAEPKSVQELNEYGVRAVGATKGRDSVNFGIQWLRQLEIVIHPKCVHTIEEFETYKWKQDKSGNVLPVPVDKNNHHIDAIRYATEHEQGTIHRSAIKQEKESNDYGKTYKRIGMPEVSGGWLSA